MTEVLDPHATANAEALQEEAEDEADQEPKFVNLDAELLEEIGDIFDIFDKNKDETIETSSLGTVMRWLKFNPSDSELKGWIEMYDPTHKGFMTLTHVKTIVNEKMLDTDTIEELIEALKMFDHD